MRKLKSQSGASILIALVLFLVATTAAVVMLNAAVTGVKSLKDDEIWQRENLAVSSAARLIASCIKESTLNVTVTETVVGGDEPSYSSDTEYTIDTPAAKLFQQDFYNQSTTAEHTITVSLSDDYPDCLFRYTLGPAEDSPNHFVLKGVVTPAAGIQKIYITAWTKGGVTGGPVTEEPDENTTITYTTTSYYWDAELSTSGGESGGES